MVVSRSEEVIVSASSFRSKRKSSRMGNVLLVLITPIMDCRFFSKRELETMNFITVSFFVLQINYYDHSRLQSKILSNIRKLNSISNNDPHVKLMFPFPFFSSGNQIYF